MLQGDNKLYFYNKIKIDKELLLAMKLQGNGAPSNKELLLTMKLQGKGCERKS